MGQSLGHPRFPPCLSLSAPVASRFGSGKLNGISHFHGASCGQVTGCTPLELKRCCHKRRSLSGQNRVISLTKAVIWLTLPCHRQPAPQGPSQRGFRMFQFEGYTLDVARSSLRTADRDVQLRPKAFEVLRYLVENADRLVAKEELIRAIWPNVIVTDEVLTHCVSEARKAIGDVRQAMIKTVPRRGYRFAAAVSQIITDAGGPPAAAGEVKGAPFSSDASRGFTLELLLPDKPSIAVLPFSNMSGNPEEDYFADGMAEEIITALSRCTWLFVIARNSSFTYKGKGVDVRQVGRALGVRYVLEGSVRRAGHRLRFTGQLIDCSSVLISGLIGSKARRATFSIFRTCLPQAWSPRLNPRCSSLRSSG
jgi:TolB-like protein